MSIQKQERQLGRIPDIVVATPGRLWEIMSASDSVYKLLGGIKFLVLDEADRMLEFGHFQELSSILKAISLRQSRPEAAGDEKVLGRQTFVFSATLAKADFVNKNKAKAGKTMEKGLSMRWFFETKNHHS